MQSVEETRLVDLILTAESDVIEQPTTSGDTNQHSPPPEQTCVSGFRINRRIQFAARVYQHVCSVFYGTGHFFTMVTYRDQTWTHDGIGSTAHRLL
jgi:hypothetical protein